MLQRSKKDIDIIGCFIGNWDLHAGRKQPYTEQECQLRLAGGFLGSRHELELLLRMEPEASACQACGGPLSYGFQRGCNSA